MHNVRRLKIAFVIKRIGVVELQSLPLVAALARSCGHDTILTEYARGTKHAIARLTDFAPDIVAYSVCSNEVDEYLAINTEIREKLHAFSLFGGAHPTYVPDFIRKPGVDAMCRGEADLSFGVFLDTFGSDSMYDTPNFSFKCPDGSVRENALAPLNCGLDSLPFPARDLVYESSAFMAQNPIKTFMAGRGCPFSCAHCFNSAYNRIYRDKGPIVRTKSVSYLLSEIQNVAGRYPLSFVRFHDDVFGLEMEWLREFSARFPREIGLPFSSYVHPRMVTEEYVELLKQAGCHAVCTAIECGNERLRNDVLLRRVSNEQIVKSCSLFKKAGIRLFSFNMVGVPGETEADMMETIELNRRAGVDFADVSIFQPYPGTKAFEYCKENGYLPGAEGGFENIYVESNLKIAPELKQFIHVVQKLFLLLVEYPRLGFLIEFFRRRPRFNRLLNFLYRLHYGHSLHKRIYASCMPFLVRLRGAPSVLFSKNRI